MHKIVHDTFELDLTNYGLSFVEENYWFTDQFFTKYSFPFPIYLTAELMKTFGYFLDDNNEFVQTNFDVVYYFGNQKESAVFQIESQVGVRLEANLRYGFDELPNFNKKLSELPLEEAIITDLYAHAKTIIPQTWPAVNYNYPQIHTDKYDETEVTWSTFNKKINNYVNTNFLVNTYTETNFANKNIIQPLPHLLHILTQGFLDAGYTLKGDLLNLPLAKKILIYTDLDYFDIQGNVQDFVMLRSEFVSEAGDVATYLDESISLNPESTYKITGIGKCFSKFNGIYIGPYQYSYAFFQIWYNGSIIFTGGNITELVKTIEIDVQFTTDADVDPVNQILKFSAGGYNAFIQPEEMIFDLKIQRIIADSPDEVHVKNELNLKNVVPDITFGNFLTEWKNLFNLDITTIGKDIYLNFIESEINYQNATNLSDFEVLKPKKRFQSDVSFLLKFDNVEDLTESYKPVFHSKIEITNNEEAVNVNTVEIAINVIPLSQKSVNLIESAVAQTGGNKQIYAVIYDGLNGALNTTDDVTELLLPSLHNVFYQRWFSFRLSSINYRWMFKMYLEQLATINKKVFAYGRYHVVKSIEKTQISKDLFEVEIETETLP